MYMEELTNLQQSKENFLIQARHLNFLKRIRWWAGFDPKDGLPASVAHVIAIFFLPRAQDTAYIN